jgi:hypothetical protein
MEVRLEGGPPGRVSPFLGQLVEGDQYLVESKALKGIIYVLVF